MNQFKSFVILMVCLHGIINSSAQFVSHDTIQIPSKTDSTGIKFMHVPADAIFIPAYYLYNHNWNNENVKMHKYDYWLHEDTTLIVFSKDTGCYFVCPVEGKVISPFGKRGHRIHAGVDLKLKLNDPVKCAFPGVVRIAKMYHGYGKMVVVRHYNGLETLYGHLNKILVKPDRQIEAGDILGLGGHTGRATCTHLHFETRFLEDAFDPETVIDFSAFLLKSDSLIITSSTFSRTKYFTGKTRIKPNTSGVRTKIMAMGNGSTYTIRNGDTLYGIARRNGSTVDALCKLNNFTKTKILHPGQKIKIK